MLNLLIAYDNIDLQLGAYLQSCFSDLKEHLNNIEEKNCISISGMDCTEEQIEVHTNTLNGERFIFVGFTHGREDALTYNRIPYISSANALKFQNCFFYTCACLSAIELGPELQRQGCLAYIGYNSEVKTILRLENIFKKCMNSGIKYFLQGGQGVKDVYSFMVTTFEEEYVKLSEHESDDFLAAALLRSNMTALVCLGNGELTLNDFI